MPEQMSFLDALRVIFENPDQVQLCRDEEELSGLHPSICVYADTVFAGKLRWPQEATPAEVDTELAELLRRVQQTGRA